MDLVDILQTLRLFTGNRSFDYNALILSLVLVIDLVGDLGHVGGIVVGLFIFHVVIFLDDRPLLLRNRLELRSSLVIVGSLHVYAALGERSFMAIA